MPRAPKEPIIIEPEKMEEEIESMSFELQSSSMEKKALAQLNPHTINILKRIAYYISKAGMTLKESCMLVDVDYEKFQEDMKMTPIIGKIIQMKELQYKKDLMYTLSQKAKSGDDKLAQWILATRYPDEFGGKKGGPSEDDDDIFFQAIQFIRKKGDNQGLINPESGRAIVVKRQTIVEDNNTFVKTNQTERIANILNGK